MRDRFDLYGALYLLCSRWHSGQWGRGYRILSRLHRAGYRPGLGTIQGNHFESPEQRTIYKQLLKYRRKL
jgi:hypothetical protein